MYNLTRTIFAFFLAINPVSALAEITVQTVRDAIDVAHILRIEEPCGYRISDHALQDYYKANGLFTPEALALIIREMKKPVASPSQHECAAAEARARQANLLADQRNKRIRTVSVPGPMESLRDPALPFHEQAKDCWTPPNDTEGLSASIRVTLNQDGWIDGFVETVTSSGRQDFDESVRQAVLRCAPYSPATVANGRATSFVVEFDGSK